MRQGKKHSVRGVPRQGKDFREEAAVRRIKGQIQVYAESPLGQLAGCDGLCSEQLPARCGNAVTCNLRKKLAAAGGLRLAYWRSYYDPYAHFRYLQCYASNTWWAAHE